MRAQVAFLVAIGLVGVTFGQEARRLEVSDFKTSTSCKPCHEQIYQQWTTSAHSRAYRDPVYQTFLRQVDEKSQGRLTQFCVSCHAPLATVTRSVPDKLFDEHPKNALLEDGVSCEFCHTLSGSEVEMRKLSLGAFLFPRTGQTEILYGRHADASQEAHRTQKSSFLLSPELCGTCHRFGHPVSGLPIQNTYEEWKASPYAAEGKRCQDCHMPAYAGRVAAGAKERPELHAHIFRGGHTEMIRNAATLEILPARNGSSLDVSVVVTNSGAGHLIPTGIPGIRQMWVEVTVFNGQKALATQKQEFRLELFDEKGALAMPWDAVRFGHDTRIAPMKSRRERFAFYLPDSTEVRVEAKLLERLVSEQAASYAGVPASPVLVMTEASMTVPR